MEVKVVTPVLKSPSKLMITVTLWDSWAHTKCSRRETEKFSSVLLSVAFLKWDLLGHRGHAPVHHFKPGREGSPCTMAGREWPKSGTTAKASENGGLGSSTHGPAILLSPLLLPWIRPSVDLTCIRGWCLQQGLCVLERFCISLCGSAMPAPQTDVCLQIHTCNIQT